MRLLVAVVLPLLVVGAPLTSPCVGFGSPAPGAPTDPFSAEGPYEGHWGMDLAADVGARVTAAAPGRVVFAGEVAGVRSVTLDHGGGIRSTVSWLDELAVERGEVVVGGEVVGRYAGGHAGGVHFSVRIDGTYVDPAPLLGCVGDGYSDALSLVP